jgi:two-component system phosphate regulon response regulator OmpR
MAGKPLILVAARDRVVRHLVTAALKPAGFRITETSHSVPSAEELTDLRPDAVIIEAEEPPSRTARQVRAMNAADPVPVLLMSALATPTRVATILDAGADEYIARPFDPAELAARVRSLIRRRGRHLHVGRTWVGPSIVDFDRRTITRDDRSYPLTRVEWALLALLVNKQRGVVLREELLSAAFGPSAHDDPALLRLAIGRLRRKLGLAPWDEGPIRTIHGLGYAFDPDGALPLSWSGRRRPAQPEHDEGARQAASASVGGDD